MSAIATFGRGLANAGLNAILPPRCFACGVTVERPGTLCPDCWEATRFISPPVCAACGLPFDFDLGPDALCGACTREPPVFDRARAVMAYDDLSKRLVLGFKHGDRTEAAPAFAGWMARAGAELIAAADVIAPVPLHWLRLFRRRYNQSALLARALAQASGRPVVADLLVRRRATPPQGRLSVAARQKNVAGAFAVKPARRADAKGRRVLLIDDVMTTGATVSACAKALRAGGAAGVDVLVLARVLRAD